MSKLDFLTKGTPFPILRTSLNLGNYHPDLKGNSVDVWLNLSDEFREHWHEYATQVKEAAKRAPDDPLPDTVQIKRVSVWAQLWNISLDETQALFDAAGATGLRAWMRRRTWELIEEYVAGRGEAVGS